MGTEMDSGTHGHSLWSFILCVMMSHPESQWGSCIVHELLFIYWYWVSIETGCSHIMCISVWEHFSETAMLDISDRMIHYFFLYLDSPLFCSPKATCWMIVYVFDWHSQNQHCVVRVKLLWVQTQNGQLQDRKEQFAANSLRWSLSCSNIPCLCSKSSVCLLFIQAAT